MLEREKLSTTALGHGVAFPHARTTLVTEIVVAVGRSREGVLFRDCGADGSISFLSSARRPTAWRNTSRWSGAWRGC